LWTWLARQVTSAPFQCPIGCIWSWSIGSVPLPSTVGRCFAESAVWTECTVTELAKSHLACSQVFSLKGWYTWTRTARFTANVRSAVPECGRRVESNPASARPRSDSDHRAVPRILGSASGLPSMTGWGLSQSGKPTSTHTRNAAICRPGRRPDERSLAHPRGVSEADRRPTDRGPTGEAAPTENLRTADNTTGRGQ
jgi:hypothetical protein